MSEGDREGFERHREAQRRAWLRLSYAERLRWLDQAKRFARVALEAAIRRRAPSRHGERSRSEPVTGKRS